MRFEMIPASSIPSVRELITEYATIEDRVRALEARVLGGSAPALNLELRRLAERERQVLAMLRRHHSTVGPVTPPPASGDHDGSDG